MGAFSNLRNLIAKYSKNTDGHFAIWTALVGGPLLCCVGVAVDMENKERHHKFLESALDSAALAAVLPDGITDAERIQYAQEVFRNNFANEKNYPLSVDVAASREEVTLKASVQIPSLMGGISGRDTLNLVDESTAILTKSDTICVLALDERGQGALEFSDSAVFKAPSCSVQVNSRHPRALISDTMTPPAALNFCSSGGAVGSFYPRVKTNCSPIEDPYRDLAIPAAASACDQRQQVVVRGNNGRGQGRAFLNSQLEQTASGAEIISDFATLSPGIYCRGLSINGANVDLEPGVYHVWGDLHFTQNAGVRGDGVTFIIKGDGNRLLIDEGAQVWLRAPRSGLTAGLVFWQKYLNMRDYVSGNVARDPKKKIATSEINSGGGLHIVGTAYLPNHELIIKSNNSVSSQSPATSFIAFQIKFAGRTNMNVAVNHVAAGLPPLKPYTDDGARLIE